MVENGRRRSPVLGDLSAEGHCGPLWGEGRRSHRFDFLDSAAAEKLASLRALTKGRQDGIAALWPEAVVRRTPRVSGAFGARELAWLGLVWYSRSRGVFVLLHTLTAAVR